jgi:hypothetical protein
VARPQRSGDRPRRAHALIRLPRRLVAGVLIGVGTIFGAKAERDQHWSIPPTMVSEGTDQEATADDDHDDEPAPGRGQGTGLPACA